MPVGLTVQDLIDYTAWQRRKWYDWLRQAGSGILEATAGPHGDGRFNEVGEVLRHIFSAEKRYIDRLAGRPITDTAVIAPGSLQALLDLGDRSRRDLLEFIDAFPAARWDVPIQFQLMNYNVTATPRKIVIHVLMHEIRHWAQLATVLRLQGMKPELHDFLFSPALGGEVTVVQSA
ncbi:MAG: DinB family protein [Bryobacterales bacterium]|nr:DinB family protein [Bryobacterales bacterium]